jgi:hypothetical protein
MQADHEFLSRALTFFRDEGGRIYLSNIMEDFGGDLHIANAVAAPNPRLLSLERHLTAINESKFAVGF